MGSRLRAVPDVRGVRGGVVMSVKIQTFTHRGDFAACHAAEQWCADHGISVGRMQGPEPRGLLWGDFDIQKWRNLSAADRAELNGTMTGNMREGPVVVAISERAK